MLLSISQPNVDRESVTGRMRKWCGHATSAQANGAFAELEPRQGRPDRGLGLWNRRL